MSSGVAYGLVLPVGEWPSAKRPSWAEISALVRRAEELGFDTVWTADEIVWRDPDGSNPRGFWECLTMTGAVAASRSTVQVGTWVISALQHNPGMVVKAAETLDEITGGRFVLGLGSGHPAGGANAFGFPQDKTVSRYAEALEIIVPLLRGQPVTFNGEFHHATGAEVLPRGPRPGKIPLMLGGLSPRTMALATTHADIWSAYARESSLPGAFKEMIAQLDRICEGAGRDPATLGRSIGVFVEPGEAKRAEANDLGVAISGSTDQITETLAGFADVGVTRVEIVPYPHTLDTLDQLAPVLAALV
jgi:alkanesulfonate monooxygenase SsuD/methylene tetrahydromethanopterin reductase-like flavin-dependent oxidoreductase (luciferase family)